MNIATTSDPIDHHATALANVTQLIADNHDLHDKNEQLGADMHRIQVRLEMMTEDRNFWRDQANSFRALVTKLATHQATIGLETIAAQAVVMSIDEAINAPKHTTPALEALEAEFKQGNEEAIA